MKGLFESLQNINNNSGGIFHKNWNKTASINITNFQKEIWVKAFSKYLQISV